jgi:hypothetical protein
MGRRGLALPSRGGGERCEVLALCGSGGLRLSAAGSAGGWEQCVRGGERTEPGARLRREKRSLRGVADDEGAGCERCSGEGGGAGNSGCGPS